MGMLNDAGKEAGLDAANALAGAAGKVSDTVDDAAKNLALDLADAVNVMAGSFDRLEATVAAESAAWRGTVGDVTKQIARFADFLDRIQIATPKG